MSLPSGHNYGCHHNPEVATNSYFSYGHGHHIEQGSASTGYRTILAYNAAGHSTRVNYYSNPSVNYPVTQTSTGVADLSDNAQVITQNRISFASLGDESATCSDGFSTVAPSPSPSTSTTGSGTSGSGNCGNCVFPFIAYGRQSDRCTTSDGDSPWCATAVDSSGFMVAGSWEYCTDPSCPGLAATNSPPMTVHPENEAGKCCKFLTSKVFLLFKLHIYQGVAFLTEQTIRRSWAELRLRRVNTPGRLEIFLFSKIF